MSWKSGLLALAMICVACGGDDAAPPDAPLQSAGAATLDTATGAAASGNEPAAADHAASANLATEAVAGDAVRAPGATAAETVSASTSSVREKAPAQIRGIYLNAYGAGSRARLAKLLALADTTELNTFVVDVKDEKGIHYRSALALPTELALQGEQTLGNLRAFVDTLHAHGLHAIARIVVFKDPILSKAKPDWSIRTPDGELWLDKAGNTWVSAWDPAVWDYNIAIAEEAARAGFDEVQFDYVRFPEPYPSLPEQVHTHANGTRTQAIVAFLQRARARLHPLGAIVAADVFGLSPNDGRDINIGQQWEDVLASADHVLPMVYPSHYLPTHLKGVPTPNRMPYETVFTSVGIGMVRIKRLRALGVRTARVIPWLQAFSAPWVDREYEYGAEQADAQIRAVYDVGLEDWIFWHPGSRYEHLSAAFARELKPSAREFTAPDELVRQTDLVDRAGAAAARERVAAEHGRRTGAAATGMH